jgi:hypothetical protein
MNAGRFAAGFLVGVIVAAVLAAGFGGEEQVTTTTTQTTATSVVQAVEPWFQPGEAVIGATVVLPGQLNIEDGVAYLSFDLVGLAPTLLSDDAPSGLAMPSGDPMELPETWELTTVAGETVTASTGPSSRSVSFELPSPDDEVSKVTLVGWRVPVPFGESVTLSVEDGATGELRRGSVTVTSVLEQSISTIVTVDFDREGDLWQSWIVLRPRDGHWRASGRQGGGMQLTWDGADAPDSIVIEDAGYEMFPVTGSIPIYDEAGLP